MAITLNVVGVFFTIDVNIPPGPTATVKAVMDAAEAQTRRGPVVFSYTALGAGNQSIVNSIMALHTVPFQSRSKKPYPKGIYRLGQTFTTPTPNPYSVWQYYIFDEKNNRVPIPGQPSYAVTTVKDGYKIVWRLVTICNAPTGLSHRMQHILPDDLVTEDLF